MSYFNDKVAVVLGCSGEGGMGYVAAERLAREGAKVVVAARSFDKVKALAARIGGHAVQCDAGIEAEVKALAQEALKIYGSVDIAVNAAGMPVNGTIADVSATSLQRAIEVNYFGNVYFIREMAAAMGKDGGAIVVFSSLSSTHPLDGLVAYASAKAATDCLVRYAALEYGKRNIRINSILPGAIWSHMAGPLFSSPGVEETMSKEVPLGRLGNPEEAAEAVLWLSGPSYVSGLQVPVAGGQQLCRYPFASEYVTGKDPLKSAVTAQATKFGGQE